jgi:hypothetical protein
LNALNALASYRIDRSRRWAMNALDALAVAETG